MASICAHELCVAASLAFVCRFFPFDVLVPAQFSDLASVCALVDQTILGVFALSWICHHGLVDLDFLCVDSSTKLCPLFDSVHRSLYTAVALASRMCDFLRHHDLWDSLGGLNNPHSHRANSLFVHFARWRRFVVLCKPLSWAAQHHQ